MKDGDILGGRMGLPASIRIYRRTALLALALLAVMSVSRLLLIGVHFERVEPTDGLWFILLQGLRFDLILAGMLLGPVFLVLPWLHVHRLLRPARSYLVPAWVALMAALSVFVEATTLSFIAEYDSRPNYLFVEYLAWPREVLASLSASHLSELVAVTVIALAIGGGTFRWLRGDPASGMRVGPGFCVLATPLIAAALLLSIRSTLDHRPVNPSTAAFSEDAMVNQLPLNSPYALLYSVYERRRDRAGASVRYGPMDEGEALALVLREARITPEQQLDPDVPTLHFQRATHERGRPFNLVIILEESLGAEFVGKLGGKNLTPELDGLAEEGIWFERMYATGTRSARGIEAIISGMTPTPGYSVVKLAKTQAGFFTLAGLLRARGYRTSFIYGGEAHFDNMKRFFLNNGFATVIDEKDYEDPVHYGSWGVSDEDLFNRAHEWFSQAGSRPFFSLVFTSSNHSPFDIPPGRVTPIDGPDGARETAVRYADYALGRFIGTARGSDYWKETVFLVIADHNSRNYGDALVPVERFRIPAVIVGGPIRPRRIEGISSQIDMLPTLLSLIGVSSAHPAIGRDLTRGEFVNGAGRAMMQFHALQAYMEDDRVIVLQPDLAASEFRLTSAGDLVLADGTDPELERKALAHVHWGMTTIAAGTYRLPRAAADPGGASAFSPPPTAAGNDPP